MTKINKSRIILAVMSVAVGLYPVVYLFLDREFGLLATKSQELLDNMVWNVGFYIHIFLGGIALLIGWMQFHKTIRLRYPGLHKTVGMIYILSVSMSAISGIYIGAFATGGIISSVGFILLGIIWLLSTLLAFWHIKKSKLFLIKK